MAKQDATTEATTTIKDIVARIDASPAKRVSSVRPADQCGRDIAGIVFVESFCAMSPGALREHVGTVTVYRNGKTSGLAI